MPAELSTYRARVGLYYCRHLSMKGLKQFSNFEFLLFISMLISKSGDIESNPGPNSSSESVSSNSDSASELSSAMFQQYFSLVHYNVQSLLPKLNIIESELT